MKRFIRRFIPQKVLSAYHLLLAYFGALIYGFPSNKLIVIGVAGTRGKTTTANCIWSILEAAGHKTGLTGTAVFRISREEKLNPYHMTMPGRLVLQKLLHEMRKNGCKFAVIETPSEGVEQWRHKGIAYDALVLTQLYPEYLEVHGRSYERAKTMTAKIFEELTKQPRKIIGGKVVPKITVVNNDSEDKDRFLKSPADKKITYGLKNPSDFMAKDVQAGADGVSFTVFGEKYKLLLRGGFNVMNALAAIALTKSLGIDDQSIKRGLLELKLVPGRMEEINCGQNFDVFVDYAHDEMSLKAALKAAREIKKEPSSKIILVLGAEGGGRDKKKRPLMGSLAARKSDYVVVTNVDPYNDDPKMIIEDIATAAEKSRKIRNKNLFAIENRKDGINKALSLAASKDIVLITGKGAEQSMVIDGKTMRWDDRVVVREELKRLLP